jgi:hypothetical protein
MSVSKEQGCRERLPQTHYIVGLGQQRGKLSHGNKRSKMLLEPIYGNFVRVVVVTHRVNRFHML